jgi:hypothetical protein
MAHGMAHGWWVTSKRLKHLSLDMTTIRDQKDQGSDQKGTAMNFESIKANMYSATSSFVLGTALVIGTAGLATADTTVDASQVIVLSDDIQKGSTEVVHASPDDSNSDDNRSGLGDGTNPGEGAGRDNASNEGTDNPGGSRE